MCLKMATAIFFTKIENSMSTTISSEKNTYKNCLTLCTHKYWLWKFFVAFPEYTTLNTYILKFQTSQISMGVFRPYLQLSWDRKTTDLKWEAGEKTYRRDWQFYRKLPSIWIASSGTPSIRLTPLSPSDSGIWPFCSAKCLCCRSGSGDNSKKIKLKNGLNFFFWGWRLISFWL